MHSRMGSSNLPVAFAEGFRLEFYADAYDVSALMQAMEDDPHPLGVRQVLLLLFLVLLCIF